MNNKIYIKLISLFFLLAIGSLFGSSAEDEASLVTIPIIEVSGETIPGWEKQIIELYHDEQGNPIPVVFRGAAKNWEAASWTPEYFAERFGDIKVNILSQNLLESFQEQLKEEAVQSQNLVCKALEKNIYDRILACDYGVSNCWEEYLDNDTCPKEDDYQDPETIETTIREHISDILLNPDNAGYLFCPLPHNATKEQIISESMEFIKNAVFVYDNLNFESQTRFPQSIENPNEEPREYSLFIGSGNSITSLHSHGSTFLAQIYGKKIARLIHPKDIEKCSCKLDDEFAKACSIDITAPDFETQPKLKGLNVYQAILEPGDVLYIPHAWLHDIRGIETSISISSGF